MKILQTEIPGLLKIETDIFPDERGVFWESFQKPKLTEQGLPEDFNPKQINFVSNTKAGVIRGIHAEPWRKYVSVIKGKAQGVYVDLRKGEGFGKVVYIDLVPGVSVFLPVGIGNSYETLEDDTYYVYAVDGHWRAGERYVGINMFDEKLNIQWKTKKESAIISEKDKVLPGLVEVGPF